MNKFELVMTKLSHQQLRTLAYVIAFMLIGFILPWWSIIFVAGVIGWLEHGLLKSVLAALIYCFIAWLLLTLAFDLMNGFRISMRLGGLVGLPLPIVANIISATLGAVLAALVAATVNQFKVTLLLARSRS